MILSHNIFNGDDHEKALYAADARVSETVEEGMRSLMREYQRKKQFFAQIAMSLQEAPRQYLRDRYPQNEYDHKRFFDDLSVEK